jgi:hypothetical protein
MSKSGYRLNIMSPKGGISLRSFTNEKGGEGLADGLVASANPFSFCDTLNFSGRPDLVALEGGEVVQAFIEDAAGIHPVFYGAIIAGDTSEPSESVVPYEASARALLLATACQGERYRRQDTAAIAYDLVSKNRHAALKVRASDFPASGTVLDQFDAVGQLGEVLDELLEATENKDYGAGLDPNGWVFFRPNVLLLEVSYEDTDYEDLPTSGNAITTATLWTFSAEPGITPWAGPYLPKLYSYLSVPDAALHERYGYVRNREVPQSAFAYVTESNFTAVGFTSPENAVKYGATTPASRTGTGTSTYTITNDDALVYGVHLNYRRDEAVGPVLFRATAGSVYYEVEIPKSDLAFKELDLPLPPHESGFSHWESFRLTVPAGGTFELQKFYPLRLEVARLEATAPLIVPERRPGQIAQLGVKPLAARIALTNAPRGRQESPSAGLRWSWNPKAGAETVTDLEVSAYEVEGTRTERVSGYYRKPRS